MYRQSTNPTAANDAKCSECGSTRLLYKGGTLICTNCEHVITTAKAKRNKYNATRTEFDGFRYDSKFEAEVAAELDLLKRTHSIQDWERQYQVEMWVHRPDGVKAFSVKHKVDFRILHNDGSYELLESKGVETDDYKHRRRLLEKVWLPMNPDHIYTVRKQVKQHRRKY